MEINVIEVKHTTYRPVFSDEDIPTTVVYIEFPEHGVVMGLSHRDDDPEGMWLADSRFDNGLPVFVHGEGSRDCNKQIAGQEILDAILMNKIAPFVE